MDGNTPVYLQLQWFDTVEEVRVSSELRNKRWNTEVAARDMLYLEKLGADRPKTCLDMMQMTWVDTS